MEEGGTEFNLPFLSDGWAASGQQGGVAGSFKEFSAGVRIILLRHFVGLSSSIRNRLGSTLGPSWTTFEQVFLSKIQQIKQTNCLTVVRNLFDKVFPESFS